MMEKNLVTKLVDFFMENDSPAITIGKGKRRQVMGSNYAVPPFEHLIACLSYITRMQTYVDLTLKPENHALGHVYFPKYSYYTINTDQQVNPLPPLSKEDRFMLSQKGFIEKCLKCNQSTIEVAKLLCHLSCENKVFSI